MSDSITLSPSGLTTWHSCARKWHYSYDRRWKEKAKISPAFGSAIHRGLDTLWNIGTTKPYPELDHEDAAGFACDTFDKAFLDEFPEGPDGGEELYTHEVGHRIIEDYAAENWEKITQLELLGCEEALYIDYPEIGATLGGRTDKIIRAPDGRVFIIDHKTCKKGSGKSGLYPSFWHQFLTSRQIDVYLLALQHKYPDAHIGGLIIDAILVHKTASVFETQTFTRTPAQLRESEQEFKESVRQIAEARRREHFPRALNDTCNAYGGCPYMPLCINMPNIQSLPANPPPITGGRLEVVTGTTEDRLGMSTGDTP